MSAPGNPRDGGQYPPAGGYEYGRTPGSGAPLGRRRNGFGTAALVLGLLALVLSWTIIGGLIFGLLALIFGLLGRARAKRGEATNGGMSVAGVGLGIIGLLIAIGLVALGMSVFNSPAGQDYQQCIEQSVGDPAKLQQCISEFGRRVGGG